MKIDFKQAREFLERVNDKDNAMIFTHTDMDGFAAGILLQDYLISKGAKTDVRIINYGVTRISDTPLGGFNKIFITDLAPDMIWEDLNGLKDKEIFYTDHHKEDKDKPIPDFVFEFRTLSQGYIPSTRTVYELTEKENKDKLWLAIAGTVSDFAEKYPENNEFLQNAYKRLGITHEELLKYLFKFNFALIGSPYLEQTFAEISKMKSLDEVAKLAKYYEPLEKDIERLRKDYIKNRELFGKVIYYNLETDYPGVKSALINEVSGKEKESVLVFATKKGSDLVSLSARNQSRKYNCITVLKEGIRGLEDSKAGGHEAAAGAQIRAEDLDKFKERLKQIKLEDCLV